MEFTAMIDSGGGITFPSPTPQREGAPESFRGKEEGITSRPWITLGGQTAKKQECLMEPKQDEKLRNIVNSSGFPLQIGLVHLIKKAWPQGYGWRTILTEHPWQHPESTEDGFIDLVVEDQHRTQVMVVECKRVRDTEWFFLTPKEDPNPRRVVNAWFTFVQTAKAKRFGWQDHSADPTSHQSEFCVVHGQDTKSRPMLERVAAQLVESTEALAHEEYAIHKGDGEFLRIYINVIVTTANLKVCKFNPESIDIATGEIGVANFETVPWVRLRKSLIPRPVASVSAKTITEIASGNERTVFVVNSERFVDFLNEWELSTLAAGSIG